MLIFLFLFPLVGITLVVLPVLTFLTLEGWMLLAWIGAGFGIMIWLILKLLNATIKRPCILQLTNDGINITLKRKSIVYPTHFHTPWKTVKNISMNSDANGDFIHITSSTSPKNYFLLRTESSNAFGELFELIDEKRNQYNSKNANQIGNRSFYKGTWIKVIIVLLAGTAVLFTVLKATGYAKELSWWSIVFVIGASMSMLTQTNRENQNRN